MSFLNKIYDTGRILLNRLYEGDIVKDAGLVFGIFGLFNFATSANQESGDLHYWAGAISAAGATVYLVGSKLEKMA